MKQHSLEWYAMVRERMDWNRADEAVNGDTVEATAYAEFVAELDQQIAMMRAAGMDRAPWLIEGGDRG